MPGEETIGSSVGARIRARRKELRLELESISRMLHVPVRALEAIEQDEYDYFSAKVYAMGIVRKFLSALSMMDADAIAQEFATEWDIKNFHTARELKPLPENRGARPLVTPKRIAAIAAIILLFLLAAFFGYRLFLFLRRPALGISAPMERESRVANRTLVVRGLVAREASLTVNGREITIDSDGNFSGAVDLRPGLNELVFFATNRFGKTTEDVRYVMVE